MSKEVKYFNQAEFNKSIKDLEINYIPKVMKLRDILEQLESNTLVEYEFKMQELTGWQNIKLASSTLGQEDLYTEAVNLESALEGVLKDDQITKSGQLKTPFKDKIRESFSTYYTKAELKLKSKLEKIVNDYNSLESSEKLIKINSYGNMVLPSVINVR